MTQIKYAVLLVNLGTPDTPTPAGVRKFLKPFLSDPRVVEIPRLLWWVILNVFVIPLRSKRVAKAYKSIWTDSGSPLLVISKQQTEKLQSLLDAEVHVDFAMAYSEPSIAQQMAQFAQREIKHVLVLPLYPQYSATTTASVYDQLTTYLKAQRALPSVAIVRDFHDQPLYIEALADSVLKYWAKNGRNKKLVMSFHGIPQANVDKGDPYQSQCEKTAELLAARLQLQEHEWQLCYQSRFGKATWLQPYTVEVLHQLGQEQQSVDIVCPAFVADCLETLEEMNVENRNVYFESGGNSYNFVPCVNANDAFIDCLKSIVSSNLPSEISNNQY